METIFLSKRDIELLIEITNNPPKPNKALKKAFKRYKKWKNGKKKQQTSKP